MNKVKAKVSTGKQLIKAIKTELKKGLLRSTDFSCLEGAWGDDFPHLRFQIETPQGLIANFDVKMNCGNDFGNIQNDDGSYSRLREMDYKGLICIEYTENKHHLKSVEKEQVKDFQLLDAYLKGVFDGLIVMTYMDEHRNYDGETYKLKK